MITDKLYTYKLNKNDNDIFGILQPIRHTAAPARRKRDSLIGGTRPGVVSRTKILVRWKTIYGKILPVSVELQDYKI